VAQEAKLEWHSNKGRNKGKSEVIEAKEQLGNDEQYEMKNKE
jgi:hypothetical protein